ncbi:ArsC family reductase [Burkholderia pseudomallei]|uniref:ArsC family reductase n=1 Tax=Burkholderia pseudomallei TaxID=28450 RepID=UPI001AD69886|nr:ArsC family reductase [Burkholderia pseudomallei]MBO7863586.1 ArsC family reductase [Burkholderia pseudomallei]MBO7876477.1 ArsC family reductase [Burkholderia pseudomallei]
MAGAKAAAGTVVYGIPNCDTVKKARTWLESHGVEFAFHDFKKAGVNAPLVKGWLADVPLDALVNRRGTTWRALTDEQKAAAESEAGAIALMIDKPSVIKRPVVVVDGRVKALGFSADEYAGLFA